MTLSQVIKSGKYTVVDVRTYGEFMSGSVPNAINIPLNEVPNRVEDFKKLDAPIILCCASGNRSGQATAFLKQYQISCMNGGSWLDVNFELSNVQAIAG